jgi:serralysin
MTYRSFDGQEIDPESPNYTTERWSWPQGFMILDIAASQHMYGADFSTNAGDTMYAWSPDSGDTWVDGTVALSPGAKQDLRDRLGRRRARHL